MASSPLISAYCYSFGTHSTTFFLILNKKKGALLPSSSSSSSVPILLKSRHHHGAAPLYRYIKASNQPSVESSDCNQNNLLTTTIMPHLYRGMTKRLEGAIATILIFLQMSLPLPFSYWNPWLISSANAVLYSPHTKVPRTGELALRRAIPANANMQAIQDSLEDISYLLRIPQRKPYGTMEGDVKKALKIAIEEKESILGSIPEEFKDKGSSLYSFLIDGKGGLQDLIQFIKQNDPDKVSVCLASSLDTVAEIELLQAPGLSFLLPEQYLEYPRLTGRGTVEFIIEKGDGGTFFPTAGGQPQTLATVQVILDGYSAPLTAGNFAKLVLDGAYDGVRLKSTDQAILVDSKPGNTGYSVPLEVKPSGHFEPLYKTTLNIQDGELPVLPLSVYGSVAMAHGTDSEEYSSPSQFFFYLYDKRNAGLGGLSFDEGQFSVFGYSAYLYSCLNKSYCQILQRSRIAHLIMFCLFSDMQLLAEKYFPRSSLEILFDLQS